MTSSKEKTHMLVVPYPAPGHMLPLINLTHKLALRGLAITILVSPKNQPLLAPLLSMHLSIQTLVLPFPTHPSIPKGVENMQELPISFIPNIIRALNQLYDPVLQWFEMHPEPPMAILSDTFHGSWTFRLCQQLGIKRIGFSPTNRYSFHSLWSEVEIVDDIFVANMSSWGFVFNSFIELEKKYLDKLKNPFIRHAHVWTVGPLLPTKYEEGPHPKFLHESIAWLNSCSVDRSVVYVGFGSQITLTSQQMEALATALERSGVKFIWALKEPMKGVQEEDDQNVVPTGFEDRVIGKGLLIKGWAPQAEILNHRAVGAYVTHCGWNSALEGLCAGVLLLAWPMQADHFYNTKLLVDEWGVAIRVCEGLGTVPDSEKMARVLAESLNGIQPQRVRAMELNSMALEAIEEGGSSYKALDGLVKEVFSLNL
ncbi:hypothetical protein LguiB_012888 [Lonicera macranthoides]